MRTSSPIALVLLSTLCALAGGCASGTGAKWYAPASWFSHAPAGAVDRAEAKQDAAREAAVKAAQRATIETAEALAAAPASRPVEVATESNAAAVALLNQAAGPLSVADLAALRKQVAGLLSENATLRAEAEKSRTAARAHDAALSERLAQADAAVAAAGAKLRDAFERENALANELRSQTALAWILGGVALLGCVAYVYVRFALGGIPGAVGGALRTLRAQNPTAADALTPLLDGLLNRHEQAAIAKHAS
jgi:regulator of replication initiation timing